MVHTSILLDGFGGFSDDGCRMVSDTAEFTECECDHLTSFCILLVRCNCRMQFVTLNQIIETMHNFHPLVSNEQDVAPRPQANLGVEVITYIGLGISIISLIVTIITYLFAR